MSVHSERRLFLVAAGRLYELVADVERYPEFVPGWRNARVLERAGNKAWVEQTLGLAGFQMRFTSRAFFDPPGRLRIRAEDGPFRRLAIDWRFEPVEGGCRVELRVDFEPGSFLLDRTARALLGPMGRRVMEAFEARARWVYLLTGLGAYLWLVGVAVAGLLPPAALLGLAAAPLTALAGRDLLRHAFEPGRLRPAIERTIAAASLHGALVAAGLVLGRILG